VYTASTNSPNRGHRRRVHEPPARDQVQLGDLLSLFRRRDQRRAAIELIDDVEDRLADATWR
jgi:hypothetical protein